MPSTDFGTDYASYQKKQKQEEANNKKIMHVAEILCNEPNKEDKKKTKEYLANVNKIKEEIDDES